MSVDGTNRHMGQYESCGVEKWIYDFEDDIEDLCTACYREIYK